MSNQEREAFEAYLTDCDKHEIGPCVAGSFQAGAAYQREQDKGLVEALENIAEYWNRDANEQAMQGACWHAIETAEAALAAFRPAAEIGRNTK